MTSIAALPSIAHPHREQALKRARLTAGFPNIVDGRRLESSRRMHISDPVTGEELASVTDTQRDRLDQTVQAAKAAFPLWSSKTWSERRDLLANAIEELKAYTEELCTILTAENGRPYGMAQWEIAWMLETYAPALLQMELPDVTWYEPSVGRITKRYVPLGVVAAISAWNLPFLLSFTKVLPSLLTGNTVVLKPAVFTPLTVLRAADYIREFLPPGVLNVISGGDDLGPWMTSHPGFQKISFTGSSETGRKVFASAAPTLKHLTLELGGNDAGIVLPDADSHAIAEHLFRSMFMLSGQGCVTLKRLFVHESMYETLTEALISCAQHQKLGDGFDPKTTLGPLQSARSLLACKQHGRRFNRRRLRFFIKGTFHRRVLACSSPSRSSTILLRKRITYSEKTLDLCAPLSSIKTSTKPSGSPTVHHMALGPLYGVKIQSCWTALHVGLMPGRFGLINISTPIPACHSAVIRIQGLASNSAKMGSNSSAMCRLLRTNNRRESWFSSRRTSFFTENPGESLPRG